MALSVPEGTSDVATDLVSEALSSALDLALITILFLLVGGKLDDDDWAFKTSDEDVDVISDKGRFLPSRFIGALKVDTAFGLLGTYL